MIKNITNGEMVVTHAYGKIDAPEGRTNKDWCREMGVTHCQTIEQVVNESDYIVVLSPDNPEMHEELCQVPLRSGKPTYVDKTFAPTKEIAVRLVNLAKEHDTPMYSSSALRFSKEIMELEKGEIDFITSVGPGAIENYLIHQVEPMVALMDCPATSLMYTGTERTVCLLINFENDKQGTISMLVDGCDFSSFIRYKSGKTAIIVAATEYFDRFIVSMVEFFRTGNCNVDSDQTIEIINILEKAILGRKTPNTWISLK